MAVSRETAMEVAALAGLALSEEELDELARVLSRILDYVGRIAEVPVNEVEPLANPWIAAAPLREDVPGPSPHADAIVAGAPDREGRFFRVPLVVTRDGGAQDEPP